MRKRSDAHKGKTKSEAQRSGDGPLAKMASAIKIAYWTTRLWDFATKTFDDFF